MSSSLKFWEAIATSGFLIVIVGVVGEGAELLVKWARKRKIRKRLFAPVRRLIVRLVLVITPRLLAVETLFFSLLVFGLAVEFWGSQKAMRIADHENALLNDRASEAQREAAQANSRTAKLESTNVFLAGRVEELRKANNVLEARTQDRTITAKTRRAMLEALENIPKGKVGVAAFQSDREAVTFGREITDLLKEARFDSRFDATPTMNATYTGLVFIVKDPDNRPVFVDVILSVFKANSIEANGWLYDKGLDSNSLSIYVFPKPLR